VAKSPSYDLRRCDASDVRQLILDNHGYRSMGSMSTYVFGVYEDDVVVAAYAWQPPPPGAAKSVCPERPQAVLSLSRMAAVPKSQRALKHISKPLRRQMNLEIDRGRWPVLVTYHDEGQGHNGYVYQCSGWTKTTRARAQVYVGPDGERTSRYSNGLRSTAPMERLEDTHIQRWESWACPVGAVDEHMEAHGWSRVPVPGKVWKSGNPAYTYVLEG
jgi:hypothetical protein